MTQELFRTGVESILIVIALWILVSESVVQYAAQKEVRNELASLVVALIGMASFTGVLAVVINLILAINRLNHS